MHVLKINTITPILPRTNPIMRIFISKIKKRSIPVIHQKRQLNKKEPQGMIELHLGGCKQNNQALEVPNELYTE